MSRTKWSSQYPFATSRDAAAIASASSPDTSPSSAFVSAAASFSRPSASMNRRVNRRPLIGKFSAAR